MYLTLISVATDRLSFTWKCTKDLSAYSHFAIFHQLFGAASPGPAASSGTVPGANATALTGAGLSVPVGATDGVHQFLLLTGKTRSGSVAADGTLTTTADMTGIAYVSLLSDPYTVYAYKSGKLSAGAPVAANSSIIIWEQDANNALVSESAEQQLAADIIDDSKRFCSGKDLLMSRYLDLLAATARFNCGDYEGAHWLVLNNGGISSPTNCGCS